MATPEKDPIRVYEDKNARISKQNDIQYCVNVFPEQGLMFEKYAERIFDALTVNNNGCIITGDKGTGKTALVKHLQYLIDNYKCPKQFYNAKVIEVKLMKLAYAIKSISEFEDRLLDMFNSALTKTNNRVILFIDNISEFVVNNNINVMTHLYLEYAMNNGLPVICCCNTSDKKFLESKHDLMKNFTEVKLKEPVIEDVKRILKHKSEQFSKTYKILIPDELSEKTVSLCDKYIKNEYCMPLKAIKVIEHAIAKHLNDIYKPSTAVKNKINNITQLKLELEEAINNVKSKGDLVTLLNTNNKIKEAEQFIKNNTSVINANDTILTDDDIYAVVSDVAGVPVTKLSESDTSKLKNMIPELTSKVIGQDETINKVCKTVKRNRLGLRKKNHTIGNFIFIGSTGVGKTFLAKKLAEYMFGSEESLIRLDMSEYTDEISVNKLIGAPPGYVGYGEGGVLCNAIKNNPYSVVLFDEIEKAHPTIYNTILQLMDEGRITDANGTRIPATNAIVILTSNIGVKEAVTSGGTMGFAVNKEELEKRNADNKKNIIEKSMKKLFSPEFLNRIDGVCYFNELTADNMMMIFDNEMKEVYESVKDLGYSLKLEKNVKEYIVKKSAEEKMGARSLIRSIQQDIVDEMTEIIINEESEKKKNIKVSLDKDNNIKIKLS